MITAWMLYFSNAQQVMANINDGVIIEHLRLSVPSDKRDAWLKAERGSWEPWLLQKEGFLGRQLYWDDQNEVAVLLITWKNKTTWKAISQTEIDQVQKSFEALARKETGILKGNPFPLQFEGELYPQ